MVRKMMKLSLGRRMFFAVRSAVKDAFLLPLTDLCERLKRTWNRPLYRLVLALWLFMVLAVCVRVAVYPHRQSVYSADYAPAGWDWLHGQEVYRPQQHFIYSPPVAALMVPFAVLPDRIGNVLWRLVCTAGLCAIAAAWTRSGLSGIGSESAPRGDTAPYASVFLLLLPLVAGNVNLGQMNLPILVLVAGSVLAVREHRWNLAALLIVSAGFIKIYPLAIGLLLALLYPKNFAWRLTLAGVVVFIVSLFLQSPWYVWSEYQHWFAVLNNDNRLDIDLYASWRDFGFLLRACGVPLSDGLYRVMEAVAGVALAIFLWVGQRRWRWTEDRLLGGVFSLGCAWMVLFGPATESATYAVLSLAVCATLAVARTAPITPGKGRSMGLIAVFVCSYALLVSSDLVNAWAHKFTHHLYVRAMQPVAALIFTAGVVWWLLRQPMREEYWRRAQKLCLFLGKAVYRQNHGEHRTPVQRAHDFHPATVRFHDGLDQTQPQTVTARGPAVVAAIEAVPDARQIVRGNAHALVAHPQPDLTARFVLPARFDADLAARSAVLEGVVEQVADDLLEPDAIPDDAQIPWHVHATRTVSFFRDVFVKLDDRRHQSGQGNGDELQAHRAVFGFGDVHEHPQHGQHALGFLDGIRQRLPARGHGGRAVAQSRLGGTAQARQRSSQIVSDVVQRLAHPADEALVAREHLVEQRVEFVQFVAIRRAGGHARGHVAALDHPARRVDEPADRTQGVAGQGGCAYQRHQHDDRGDRQQRRAQACTDLPPAPVALGYLQPAAIGHRFRVHLPGFASAGGRALPAGGEEMRGGVPPPA